MKLFCTFILSLCSAAVAAEGLDGAMRRAGLVDVTGVESTLRVELRYATEDNFTRRNMYGDLRTAYLQPEFARMLAAAQRRLAELRPGHSLLVWDAARPMSAQRTMFRVVAGTPQNIYVANPAKGGGRHNFGAAVDVTIVDASGCGLDMGTPFDHFGAEAHVGGEEALVARGAITRAAAQNRALLRKVMLSAGFSQHPKEWWHFHKYTVEELRGMYPVLDF